MADTDKDNKNTLQKTADELRRSVQYQAESVDYARSLGTELKDILGVTESVAKQNKSVLDLTRGLVESASENNDLLRRNSELRRRMVKDEKLYISTQTSINSILKDNFEIYNKLDQKTSAIHKKEKEYQKAQKLEKQNFLDFLKAKDSGDKKAIKHADELYKKTVNRVSVLGEELKEQYESLSVDEKKLVVLKAVAKQLEDIQEDREKELAISKDINKSLGIAGALFGNLDKIGTRFGQSMGINLGVFSDAVAEAKDKMYEVSEAHAKLSANLKEANRLRKEGIDDDDERIVALKKESLIFAQNLVAHSKSAKEYEKNEKRINQLKNLGAKATDAERQELEKLLNTQTEILENVVTTNEQLGLTRKTAKSLASTFPVMKDAFKTMAKDATVVGTVLGSLLKKTISGIINGVVSIDQKLSDSARSLGISREESYRLRENLNDAALSSESIFINGQSMADTLSLISEEYGVAFSKNGEIGDQLESNLQSLTRMKEEGQFSNEAVQNMAVLYQLSGKSVDDIQKTTAKITVQTGLQNKVNISNRKVLEGMAQASNNTRLHLSKNPEALAKATAAAIALGTNLKEIEGMAQGFLDFESSITAEMEAQIITGKEFSTSGLRYAYAFGTAEDQARELGKVMEDMNLTSEEWSKMHAFDKESLANTLKIDKEQLATMITRKEVLGTLSQEAYEARQKEFMDLAKKTSVEEALAKMGDDELNRQFAQEANAAKMAAVQQRLATLLEKAILPISEKVADVVVGWVEQIAGFTKGIKWLFSVMPLGKYIGMAALATVGIVAAIAALGLKGTPMMPMFTVDMTRGLRGLARGGGKVLGALKYIGAGFTKLLGVVAPIAGTLAGILAVIGTIQGMISIFTNAKKLGYRGMVESFGGTGIDALRFGSAGLLNSTFENLGVTVKGLNGTESAMARSLYRKNNPEIGNAMPTNEQLVADIKKRGAAGYTDEIYKGVTEVNDALIDSKGGLLVKGQKGLFKLNKQDSIVAGTNLLGSDSGSPSPGGEKVVALLSRIKDLNEKYVGINQEHITLFKNTAKEQLRATEKGNKALTAYETLTGKSSYMEKAMAISNLTGKGGKLLNTAQLGMAGGQKLANYVLPNFNLDQNLDPEKADRLRKSFEVIKSLKGKDKLSGLKMLKDSSDFKELLGKGVDRTMLGAASSFGGYAGSRIGGKVGSVVGGKVGGMFKNQEIGGLVEGLVSDKITGLATKHGSKLLTKGMGKLLGKGAGAALGGGGGIGGLLGGAGGGLAGGLGPALAALGPIAGIAAGAAGLFFGGRALIRKRKAAKERQKQRAAGEPASSDGTPLSSRIKKDKRKNVRRAVAGMALGGGIGLAVSQVGKKKRRRGILGGLKGAAPAVEEGLAPDFLDESSLVPASMESPDLMGDELTAAPSSGMYLAGASRPGGPIGMGGSNADIIEKLEELIKTVKSGTGIYMNGNKVGEAMVLGSTSMS